jgi:ATP-dependent DNA helicase DinG
LEDVISDVASVSLSPRRLQSLASTVGAVIVDERLKTDFQRAADELASSLSPVLDQRIDIESQPTLLNALTSARDTVTRGLDALGKAEESRRQDDDATRQKVIRATIEATRAIVNIDRLLTAGSDEVVFTEGSKERPVLTLAPLEVGSLLKEKLWTRSVSILTSATVPRNLTHRIGLDAERTESIDVGSPFNYEEQALLYCPSTIADPRAPHRDTEVAREIHRLIELAGGRTMALFTTVRAMRHHAAAFASGSHYPVLVQDDMPRAALLERFASEHEACLFATAGFFQGVDVPGETLSQVIIDKIPFPRPDDPLLEARRKAVGNRAFSEIDLPRAATMLAQAAGRLIRTASDRGVVAVLDPRLANKPYGRELVAALPGFRRTTKFEEVSEFFGQIFR